MSFRVWHGPTIYVHCQISHRKGVTSEPFDVYIQHKIHRKLSDYTLKLIALHLTGGYQTGAVKAIWDSSQDPSCSFCGQMDTHAHPLLECPSLLHVRQNHPDAVTILGEFLWSAS